MPFLDSNRASYITGHILMVDGGFLGGAAEFAASEGPFAAAIVAVQPYLAANPHDRDIAVAAQRAALVPKRS